MRGTDGGGGSDGEAVWVGGSDKHQSEKGCRACKSDMRDPISCWAAEYIIFSWRRKHVGDHRQTRPVKILPKKINYSTKTKSE